MDGLEEKFGDQIDVRRLDADNTTGSMAYRAYSLRGHPAYLLLEPSGDVLWSGLGELPGEVISNQMLTALREP